MKALKILTRVSLLTALAVVLLLVKTGSAHAATDYTTSRLMDDQIFDNANSMNEAAIQNFINGSDGRVSGGSPCLKNYTSMNFHWDGNNWNYGDGTRVGNDTGWQLVSSPWNSAWGPATVPSWTIVYQAAQVWNNLGPGGVNPQVILSTLQKEESLITGTDCAAWRYNSAMGYACPDSGGCNPKYAGFTKQVLWATWQLGFNRHRAVGQTSWDGDDGLTYSGIMTQGTYKRCGTCSANFYDGYTTIDNTSVYMSTAATASLYTYTPHLGNSTPVWFEQWFGPATLAAYNWQIVSTTYGSGSMQMIPGQKQTLTLVVKNIGSETWSNSGSNPVRIGTAAYRTSAFQTSSWYSQYRPTTLQEATVAPGQNGTFIFDVQAPNQTGYYPEGYNLVAEGLAWFKDIGFNFPLQVVPPTLTYQVTSQTVGATAYTGGISMTQGDTTQITVTLKNTGNQTWSNSGNNPVRLATAGYHISTFQASDWISQYRVATLQEATVAPGGTGTFVFHLKASQAGNFTESFGVVVENQAWFTSPNISFNISVSPITFTYSVNSITYGSPASTYNGSLPMNGGDTQTLTLSLKNTGTATWSNSTNPVKLATSAYRTSVFQTANWPSAYRAATLQQATVAPGSNGTFLLEMKAPFSSGTYHEAFNFVAEGLTWFTNPDLVINVSVTSPSYTYQITGQSYVINGGSETAGSSLAMLRGGTGQLIVHVKNTGTATWSNTGSYPVRIATSAYRTSPFQASTWVSAYRPVALSEATVAPGGTGTFVFDIVAPNTAGTYQENFGLVADNAAWFNDLGLHFNIIVN